jgi:signal transduction histidine kinase
MNLGFLSRKANHLEEPVRARVAETSELIQEALKEIRVVSHLLHPPLLDEMGLAAALRTYIEGFSNRAKVQVALTIEENFGRLPQDLETGIFRIVQESLTNIHRHAESTTASVSVLRSREQVQIIVQDRGKGIPESVDHGVGLRGMRERVAQFGGLLEIETSSSGTTITSTFPING